ncbi:MAG TPA: DUF5682 family protein [Kofleriaceae bacterium]|nr:DUF5682 family protein [Kofleriaceae bacterium]
MTEAGLEGSLDYDRLREATEAVLAEPLYWFPVRHHSPNVARHLRAAMLARKPKVVFLEAPAPAQALVPHLVDAKTKPPVAIYVSYRDDANRFGWAGVTTPSPEIPARYASWYPMLPYSPEYIALRTAKELGADVVFMDLPSYALIRPHPAGGGSPEPGGDDDDDGDGDGDGVNDDGDGEDANGAGDGEPRDARPAGGPSWEWLVERSTFYEALARTAGYRTWDEAWDALFEQASRHEDTEAFRRDLAAFCAGVRATTARRTVERDGTLPRERFMWRTIRGELARRKLAPDRAMVVCGGFHLFLDRDDATPPPELPEGTVYCTVTPYSFLRTSELSGYGAGNRAPRFYQRLWEAFDGRPAPGGDDPAVEAMVRHVVAVLAKGRTEAEGLSSADAIAVTQHARMLASLRGRPAPILDDIRDALIACCCKGRLEDEGAPLVEAMGHAEVGSAVGKVTPALGQLPLVNDFYGQLDALGLDGVMSKDKKLKLTLDLREEHDARRSAFLHRLVFLEVPIGKPPERAKGEGGTLFREQWALAYSPGLEDALVERTLYGDTIEAAALALLEEQLAASGRRAGETCKRLVDAVAMDLPELVVRLEAAAGHAVDEDKQFGSLCEALVHLLVLDRLAGQRRFTREVIAELVRRCFAHACFAIPNVASVPAEEQDGTIAHLKSLAEAVQAAPRPEVPPGGAASDGGANADALDRDLFVENVTTAALAATVPFMQGAFAALLSEMRAVDPADLARRVAAFARARPDTMVLAGEFLDGAFAVAKTSILLGAGELVTAIDELIRTATWEQFVVLLPRVRHAFERLHDRHRLTFSERVAESYGLKEAAEVAELRTSVGAAVQMAAIDAEVAAIMKEWTF